MARKSGGSRPDTPQVAHLTPDQMRIGIQKFERRIKELEAFDPESIQSRSDPKISALRASLDDALASVFEPSSVQYNRYRSARQIDTAPIYMGRPTPIAAVRAGLEQGKATAIGLLNQAISSLKEELELQGGEVPPLEAGVENKAIEAKRDVFIVHGRDNEAKVIVARFLEHLDLVPVILHEQPDRGRTIIEKFSDHAGSVGFAVVLLTPDDIGGPKPNEATEKPDLKPRARQNVLLELGFFIGKLGRANVCALHKGSIEIPSDYQGVLFKQMDEVGHWQLELARELKASGIDIDLNKAFE